MTLPGGPANKLGNRYEKWWTLSEFVRILHGSTEAIRIEDPGVEKTEFVVTTSSRRELHQVKRSHPSGKWSLAALGADGLLQTVGEELAGNNDRFVFVSGSDARELSDLCDAARDAESAEEFERVFLADTRRLQHFEKLIGYWACDVPTAVARLLRIEVRTIGERDLEEKVRWGVEASICADPGKVLAELLQIVENSVHRKITRRELVEELAQRGYPLRRLRSPAHAGVAVQEATDRYLNAARQRLIRGRLVSRAAAKTMLSRLEETPSDSVMTGGAGSGKTACVVEVVEALQARGLPVLAFRLDRVLSASTTKDLGRRLDLEESPVLVLAAAVEAAGRPGVLIVDQLDAVSTMSGRSSDALDLVERLLHEARGVRARAAIHTVVVCRAFDWKNDPRLRQLMPDSHAQVDVTEFRVVDVKKILADAGFEPAVFQEHQVRLLQLPQNLSLFLEAGFDASRSPAFGTATELFDRYWTEKRQSVERRVAPSPDQWMKAMEILCDEMTAAQQLSVAREKLDKVSPAYLDQLASEGVVTFDGRCYGFGHESFFDYCFARVFFTRSESLVSFLKGSEQHLFRRAQVRQVLAYLRDADSTRYVRELGGLLSDNGIRPHIKDLAFALLAEVTDPTEEEWTIWEKWLAPALKSIKEGTANPDKLSAIAWRLFFGSSSWFVDADRRGVIESWLASGNDWLADAAVNYLRSHQRHAPDRVAALLEPYADRGGAWASRLRFLMEWADHHTSRRFFDLFLRLVDNGTLDEARGPITVNSTFWSMLHNLGENRPEWVPEVLTHWLRRRLTVICTAGEDLRQGEELLGYDQSAVKMLDTSAKRAPAVFVEHVLPVVLEISDFALTGDEMPKRDTVWPILIKTEYPGGEDACLSALAGTVATLAREGGEDLRDVIADLRRRDTHIANHLLLALYAGAGARYADEAISLLCDEPWRFKCGFNDSPNWCAMEMTRAVVSHCTAGNREKFEAVILCYVSPDERTSYGYTQGQTSFNLLSVIPAKMRSTKANARFEELVRKFGKPHVEPRGVTWGLVRSPIEEHAAKKMPDDQWLRAIVKYRSADRRDQSRDELRGGARQLAEVLETQVKKNPDRFAQLSLKFPADVNPVYLERTLAALKSAAVTSDLKLQVCRKAFAVSREPCGRSIADVLGSIADPLPDDAVRMLHWLATEHEDPASEAWQEDAGGGQTYYNGDIYTNGINTTRGRAAEAIRDLILNDAAYVDRFRVTLDRMIRDPSAAVLSCVAGTLRAVANHDPALGQSLFLRMNMSEERLLATLHVYEFVRGSLDDSFAELRPIVERVLRSTEPKVCQAGGRLASLAALRHKSAADFADEVLHGADHQWNHGSHIRLGVAEIASAAIGVPKFRSWSEKTLIALFNNDNADVRHKAASCFRNIRDESVSIYEDLITAFCDSKAFDQDSFWILQMLEASQKQLSGMTYVVCEKFLGRFVEGAKDIRTGLAGNIPSLTTIIFRTYQQHQNDEWASRSLELIDHLCLEGIVEAGHQLEQFER